MEITTKTRYTKPNRTKVQDELSKKIRIGERLSANKKQKIFSQLICDANKEYEVRDKLACIDKKYQSPKFINYLDEFAIVNVVENDSDALETFIAYIHEVEGIHYAIDVKSGTTYYLDNKCRGKFKNMIDGCQHTWKTLFDEEKIEDLNKIAYYDVPVSYAFMQSENIDGEVAPDITIHDAANDIMNYILMTNGLSNLNSYTETSYYKK